MYTIRPFIPDDIEQAATLHGKVLYGHERSSPEKRAYWKEVFFENPWRDEDLPSWVCQKDDGSIVGFIGVIPRCMAMNGRPIRAAISTHFVVEPKSRGLTGVMLMRKFLAGPQDLSISEGNHSSRIVWEGLGGSVSLLHSNFWMCPLRPARYLAQRLGKSKPMYAIAMAAVPLCKIVDSLAASKRWGFSDAKVSSLEAEDTDVSTLITCISTFSRQKSLVPQYDERSLQWLLTRLESKENGETLRKVVFRDAKGTIAGWYVYCVKRGAFGEVVQMEAQRNFSQQVITHLFHDAYSHGAMALSGRIDPILLQEPSPSDCFLRGAKSWLLVHSTKPELTRAVQSGDVFLTRLEGEWWIPFGSRA